MLLYYIGNPVYGIYRGYIRIMDKKMENTSSRWGQNRGHLGMQGGV